MTSRRARLFRPAVPLVFVVAFAAFAVASAAVRSGGEALFESTPETVPTPAIEPNRARREPVTPDLRTARPIAPAPPATPAKPLVFPLNGTGSRAYAPLNGTGSRAYATPLDGTGSRAYATPVPASTQLVAQARPGDTPVRTPRPGAVPAPVVAPAPVAPPALSPGDSLAGVGAKLLIGSLILVGALWAVARFAKRLPIAKFLPNANGPIRITARSHLGPRSSLALVEVGGTTLLVAMTGTGIQALHVWSDGAGAGGGTTGPSATPRTAAVPGQLRGLQSWLGGRG